MRKILTAGLLALGLSAGSAQAATTLNISFTNGNGATAAGTSVYENFDEYASGTPLPGGTNAIATSMSQPGVAIRPTVGSTGSYAAVEANGSYTTTFGPSSVFSFVLGSLDTFNTLVLRSVDGTLTTLSGAAIINNMAPADGSTAEGVVTYRVTSGSLLNGATFLSSGNSFEFDNLASTAVPEPAAWGMMILGFGLVGGVLRRRSAAKVSFA